MNDMIISLTHAFYQVCKLFLTIQTCSYNLRLTSKHQWDIHDLVVQT